jgi:LPS sulfotransferase NodH
VETKKLLVVASVERTGSTLLCSILRGTAAAGNPVEYLNIHTQNFVRFRNQHGMPTITPTHRPISAVRKLFRRSEWRDISYFSHRSYVAYLTRLAEVNTTQNGVFGIKMHWNQYKRHMLDLDLDIGHWGVPVHWVRIMRQNEIRQAISFVRAFQSESWNSNMKAQREPVYDSDAIENALARINEENAQWQKYFVDNKIEPLDITYEQLTRDMDATVRLVMNHIDSPIDSVPAPQTKKQSDATSKEWAERFVLEHPEHAHRANVSSL